MGLNDKQEADRIKPMASYSLVGVKNFVSDVQHSRNSKLIPDLSDQFSKKARGITVSSSQA